TRAELCELVGLRTDRPLLLYLGSSSFIAPQEADFIQEWLAQLRAAGSAELAEAGVIVRPHPQNPPRHADGSPLDLSGAANAVVWPPAGANPTSDQRKRDYFDSIHHSAAVIGINTSGLIESSIVGRRVYTVLADQFRDTQEGTLHFRYLVQAGGGMLVVANSFREHLEQLADAVARETPEDMRAGFLEAFIRPHGLDEPATPRLVAAVESLAAARPGAGQPVAAAPSRDEAAESPAGEAEAGISTIQVGNISTG
ncbi:MAG TPA: hypothetical protein VF066_05930, partial [Thermoleophilaceae bacterium]